MNNRILVIDDDTNLLSGLRRQLHRRYRVETADSGERALGVIGSSEPFAIVICDMRMPGMDGVETLKRIREASPDTIRMMLTGNVDQQTAVDAVNQGHIFRFLNKPVSPDQLFHVLDAGLEQYRLVTAEKELLSKTLAGSVKVLTDVLSLVNPVAFARTSRVRRLARQLAEQLEIEKTWELELAASLGLVGCVVAPEDESSDASPDRPSIAQISHDLISHLPRLEGVGRIVLNQDTRFDDRHAALPEDSDKFIPLAARILKVALDYDELVESGAEPAAALKTMTSRYGWYDSSVIEALEAVAGEETPPEFQSTPVDLIPDNAILAEDVVTEDGTLLLSKGQEISRMLRLRLSAFVADGKIDDVIKVVAPAESIESTVAQKR